MLVIYLTDPRDDTYSLAAIVTLISYTYRDSLLAEVECNSSEPKGQGVYTGPEF